jgi:hypothetical protein
MPSNRFRDCSTGVSEGPCSTLEALECRDCSERESAVKSFILSDGMSAKPRADSSKGLEIYLNDSGGV